MPTAPRLIREPCDDVAGVLQFLRRVFVRHQPVRIPVPAHVHPDGRIAMPCEIRVHDLVARRRSVALAVGDVFQDRGHGAPGRIRRHPDPRRQAASVGQHDAHVGVFGDRVRELFDDLHRRLPFAIIPTGQAAPVARTSVMAGVVSGSDK
jgi:hypothetical protein